MTWNLDYNQIAIPEHRLVRWLFGVPEERPPPEPAIESLQSASSRVKFVCASSGAFVDSFRVFCLFRGCTFDRASIGRTGEIDNRERDEIRENGGDAKDPFEARPILEPDNSSQQHGEH